MRWFIDGKKTHLKSKGMNCGSNQIFYPSCYSISAISSYCTAIKLLEDMDKSAQASGLCLEIGDKLRDLGKVSEAVGFYQRSADLRYHHQEILSFNVENLD